MPGASTPIHLKPAADLAERGFKVDKTFNQQTADNQADK